MREKSPQGTPSRRWETGRVSVQMTVASRPPAPDMEGLSDPEATFSQTSPAR